MRTEPPMAPTPRVLMRSDAPYENRRLPHFPVAHFSVNHLSVNATEHDPDHKKPPPDTRTFLPKWQSAARCAPFRTSEAHSVRRLCPRRKSCVGRCLRQTAAMRPTGRKAQGWGASPDGAFFLVPDPGLWRRMRKKQFSPGSNTVQTRMSFRDQSVTCPRLPPTFVSFACFVVSRERPFPSICLAN